MTNIHANCISINNKGVLILGSSGSGKSDLSFRLITNKKAFLVSDDQTIIEKKDNHLFASPPKSIEGLLEIRGIGIKKFPFLKSQKIDLVVELCNNYERLPKDDFYEHDNIKIKKIRLNPFEISCLDKLQFICDELS